MLSVFRETENRKGLRSRLFMHFVKGNTHFQFCVSPNMLCIQFASVSKNLSQISIQDNITPISYSHNQEIGEKIHPQTR